MASQKSYVAMTPETVPARLSLISNVTDRLGPDPSRWTVKEVGDGNLNFVFIVTGPTGVVIAKQALPYVRLVGESWPLPLYRAYYEYHALSRQAARDPDRVPQVLHFDETQALIVMEYLTPHVILRRNLIAGLRTAHLGDQIGRFCARMAFRGSELSMTSADKKADVALFCGNVAIPAITEGLVFTDPYQSAAMNHHTQGLGHVVDALRSDAALKARAQRMLMRFASNTETMLHGDLHSGSIMVTQTEARVIDPEFAQYGPMGFDIGMLIANYLMAYFSQPAHRDRDLEAYQDWILSVIEETATAFEAEFRHLWRTERTGMLFPRSVFEDQGHDSMAACSALLHEVWTDAVAFCGIEMHRRCLSLAHNADFEQVSDISVRAALEARNLRMATELVLGAETIADAKALTALARIWNQRDAL